MSGLVSQSGLWMRRHGTGPFRLAAWFMALRIEASSREGTQCARSRRRRRQHALVQALGRSGKPPAVGGDGPTQAGTAMALRLESGGKTS